MGDRICEVLKVGSSINIKRTDGRIHSAIVANINFVQKSATVEWFECGETKGKEIDVDIIQSLNPDIVISASPNSTNVIDLTAREVPPRESSPSRRIPQAYVISRDLSGSSEDEISATAMTQSGRFSHKLDESDDDFNSNQFSSDTATISNPTRASMHNGQIQTVRSYNGAIPSLAAPTSRQSTNGHPLNAPVRQNNGHGSAQIQSRPSVNASSLPQPQPRPVPVNNVQEDENTAPRGPRRANVLSVNASSLPQPQPRPVPVNNVQEDENTAPRGPRRTNVLREVEKLKKNREERRQRQAEERAEKEAFMQLAPGNPHWELYNMILDYRRGLDIKPLSLSDGVEDHLITVCVRKRPLNSKEIQRKEIDVITIPSKNQLVVHEPKNKVDLTKYLENQLFRFDYAFDEACTNDMVYRYSAQPLIKTIFEGGFATCFAYGQTGSGKTHTMGGDFNGKTQDCQKGIYAMAAADVFRLAASPKYRHLKLVVSASFFEIYSGKVFDLLNNKSKLRILEDGKQQVQVVGLTEKVVVKTDEVLKLIQKGNQARTSGTTFANSNSSRSHAVFQIYLRSNENIHKIYGKFSLIDLAGNERGADTSSADRQTRIEGAEINKSLLALKECIRALGRKGAHLPFRVSKLTQVLRDSFVGSNSRTCMIAMLSPGVHSCEHTLNTLRYADRVKELGGGDLPTNDGDQNNVESQDTSERADLMQLNDDEDMTPEMINFHQVISELEIAEENMLDQHKQLITEVLPNYQEKGLKLLRKTDEVTYDQEDYCKKWKEMVAGLVSTLTESQALVEEYLAKMGAEERLSRSGR